MKKAGLVLIALACLTGVANAQMSKDDLQKLVNAGISDGVIMSFIRSRGPVERLSAQDIVELKKAGAHDAVINLAVETSTLTPATQTAPLAAPPPEKTVVVHDPVYVDVPPSYYYYDDPGVTFWLGAGYPYYYRRPYCGFSHPVYRPWVRGPIFHSGGRAFGGTVRHR